MGTKIALALVYGGLLLGGAALIAHFNLQVWTIAIVAVIGLIIALFIALLR